MWWSRDDRGFPRGVGARREKKEMLAIAYLLGYKLITSTLDYSKVRVAPSKSELDLTLQIATQCFGFSAPDFFVRML